MITKLLACLLVVVITEARYEPNWDSINSRPLPNWFDEAKFGIFIHCVPSYANWTHYIFTPGAAWYWYRLGTPLEDNYATIQFHERVYGKDFPYQAFAKDFTAEMWDPYRWADLIAASGAKYTVLTSKHHEGFCNWPSSQSWNWNSVDIGPKRDVVGEFAEAVRSRNVTLGLYYSLYEWYNPIYIADKESGSPPTTDVYIQEHMMPQLKDLVERYKPSIVWSDGDWDQTSDYWSSTEFLAWLYNDSPVKDYVITNDRWGNDCRGKNGGYYTPYDGYDPGSLTKHKWEDSQTIGTAYCYNRNEHLAQMLNATQLIQLLATIVSTGGNLLLDIGPMKDGNVPVLQEERLIQMGEWLQVNGEAIYSTKPWRVQNDTFLEDVWFTSKDDAVYAIFFTWPDDGVLFLINPIPTENTQIWLLGYPHELKWDYKNDKLAVMLPPLTPKLVLHFTWTLKMTSIS